MMWKTIHMQIIIIVTIIAILVEYSYNIWSNQQYVHLRYRSSIYKLNVNVNYRISVDDN